MELIGFLLPALIDTINKHVPNTYVRFWIAVVICSLVGAFVNYLYTSFAFATPLEAFNSVAGSIMQTFGWSQFSFKLYENTQMRSSIKNLTP